MTQSGQCPEQLVPQRSERRPRFLLVDDEPLVLRALRRVLRAARPLWEVVEAQTAQQALIELANREFDVVVTDLDLGHASGLELVEWLGRYSPEVACVVHSGRLVDYAGHPSLSLAARLVAKPAEPGHLVGVLNDALWQSVSTRRCVAVPTS